MNRRSALKTIATGTAALAATSQLALAKDSSMKTKLKGNIHHSVCKWCYKDIPLDTFCQAAKKMGLESVELLKMEDKEVLDKHDLICAVVSGVPGGIVNGLNRVENHDKIAAFFEETLPQAANAGYPSIICFSGNRDGMDDEEGLENCAQGLRKIVPMAEKHGVTVIMELLNSKVNHPDYMCDLTPWGVELVDRIGSERFKLLYDIYHMQIMEGDIIATIRKYHSYFAHYHTGGVPGRNEIDNTQELYYPAIMEAIVETGFTGFVAQEFIPAREDALASLKQGVEICDV